MTMRIFKQMFLPLETPLLRSNPVADAFPNRPIVRFAGATDQVDAFASGPVTPAAGGCATAAVTMGVSADVGPCLIEMEVSTFSVEELFPAFYFFRMEQAVAPIVGDQLLPFNTGVPLPVHSGSRASFSRQRQIVDTNSASGDPVYFGLGACLRAGSTTSGVVEVRLTMRLNLGVQKMFDPEK